MDRGRKEPFPRVVRGALAAAMCASTGVATAQTPAVPLPAALPSAAVPSVAASPGPPAPSSPDPRDPETYRGRRNGTTPGEVAAWIPRVLFYPLHAVTEYGLRIPIYAVAEFVDRRHIVPILDHWLHPTPDISLSPTLSLDTGLISYVGFQGEWRNLGVLRNDLLVQGEIGGLDAFRIRGRDRLGLGASMFVGVHGEYFERPDRQFFGFGPHSSGPPTRFGFTRGEAFAFAGIEPDNHLRLELGQGFRADWVGPTDHDDDHEHEPPDEDGFDPDEIPGYGQIRLAVVTLDLKLDSRLDPEAENNGVRLVGNLTYARDVSEPRRVFLTGELDAEGAVEVSKPDRVLAARLYAADTQPLGSEPVPFSHLPTLGWDKHRGYSWGRFRGESALMAQLQYRYPIAYYVDAQWTASVGNVFSEHFRDLQPSALTACFGFGLRTRRTGMRPLELTFAFGTTPFDRPFDVSNVRVFLGTVEGL